MGGALTLLFIRHAEKPEEPDKHHLGRGLTAEGEKDTESLVISGWQRAGTWAALFGKGFGGYPVPDKVYAAQPGKPDRLNHPPSRRPSQTVSVLAACLGKSPNEMFGKGDEGSLATELLKLTGVVLVCWEHQAIVNDILPKIPVSQGKPPAKWHDDRFDVVLRFDRPDGEQKFIFQALYPKLLAGDSDAPVEQGKARA